MVDIYEPAKRSAIMSRVSNRDSKIEICVRRALFSAGLRYRKNVRALPGTPDIVLPRYKTIIFTHGCFWHGHNECKASRLPDSRRGFWEDKIKDNVARDKRNIELLDDDGWRVIILWQCEISSESRRRDILTKLIHDIKGS